MAEAERGANEPVTMGGGRAMAEMLRLHDAAPMFGMGGFQLLPFYEAVRELGMVHTLINDERCGIFAADAWARIAGRPGVCDATLGPGATNLATGLVESLNAGVPLVVFTGNTNRDHAWKNMTQESRQLEILGPAVKEVIRIEQGTRIPEHIRRAYRVATSGRPGPVLVDVPEDICHGEFTYASSDFHADPATTRMPAVRARPDTAALADAAARLSEAKRPVILAGGGVHLSDAADRLTAFADRFNIPVAHTLSGKGAIPCSAGLNLGLFGRYSRIANDFIESADLIFVVGCKLGEIATKRYSLPPAEVPLIHLDILAEEIGRWASTDLALWGDIGATLDDLMEAVDGASAGRRAGYAEEVAARMATWREETAPRYHSTERPINMARMIHELRGALPDDGIVVADGGFAAHWTGLLFDTQQAGRTYVVNRGFASIGYGLPGCMGAQRAAGDRPVVGITGDGGFNMVLGELETARRLGLGFTIAVVNNAASGYVKALQHVMFGGQYQSSDLSETNYAAVATALGCEGIRVEDPEELGDAFRRGIANRDLPTILDVVVTRDPAQMLPGVDNRSVQIKKGDRIA
jgi:acetolactate synthase-1/2/3 large subunit